MSKIIAVMNMTLDGFCDHTSMNADEETHKHYSDLLAGAGTLLYGRVTYQLMESYWPAVVQNPTGDKSTDEFARTIDDISKIVFSRTLKEVEWKNTQLKKHVVKGEILALKEQTDQDILVGSPGLILACMQLDLIDEYQLCLHPVVAGSGLPLFKNLADTYDLNLLKSKTFECGAILLYYTPRRK